MKIVMRICATLCVLLISSVAIAQDTNWNNVGGDALWANNANWSSGAVVGGTNFVTNIALPAAIVDAPATGAARVVTDGGGAIDITATGQLGVAGQLLMGNSPGSSFVNVDGFLGVGTQFAVGTAGGGDGNVTVGPAGSVIANGSWMIVGFGGGTTGTVDVNGGSITTSADQLGIGWDGAAVLNVNGGGVVNADIVLNIGVNAGSSGDVFLNDGTINAGGVLVGLNGSASLTIDSAGVVNNAGGFGQAAGSPVTVLPGGQFIFEASPLEDVETLVNGNPDWLFPGGTSSITGALGSVVVTNVVPEPTSLVLIACGVCLTVCRRQRRA